MESNPYAPPQVDITSIPQVSNAERIREEHLKTEATIKSVGTLYYLGTIIMVMFFLSVFGTANIGSPVTGGIGLLFIGLGLFQGWTAHGLRRLHRWARVPAIILSCVGLLGFPMGTLIGIYFLVTLCSSKATMVFSDEYKQIIAATPHMKYKTSRTALIVLLVLLAILAAVIVYNIIFAR